MVAPCVSYKRAKVETIDYNGDECEQLDAFSAGRLIVAAGYKINKKETKMYDLYYLNSSSSKIVSFIFDDLISAMLVVGMTMGDV